jgi:S1-C subfamily serine protease
MIGPSLVALAALAIVLATAGCVSLDEPGIPLDAPIALRPAAGDLLGARMEDVLVRTEEVVTSRPFDTQLVRRVALQAKPAVVSIYTKTQVPVRVSLLPIRLPLTSFRVHLPGKALGSGFFIHPSGYLLTNNHVIRNAREISALTRDEDDLGLIVVARDPVFDLALLKVKNPARKFPVLSMGESDAVRVGDMVIAVGNPLGLGHSTTFGIISQTGRNLSGVSKEESRSIDFLQTDTAINPGSSGGPLITLSGAWIGVNTGGAAQAQGIGFAVPSSQVREFLNEVLAGKGEAE